ncbi:hypothetical protein [Methanosarcina sp.]|uniref:hypothetical protein n=1 Tax=Methanosarcina sp. TaxID=2213 RepID=UPI003BB5B0EC
MRGFLSSFSSPVTSIERLNVTNLYNRTKHNIAVSMKRIVRADDSNAKGKYHAIDTKMWEEIENHIMNENILGVGREHKLKDAVIYIQLGKEGRTIKLKNCLLFHKRDFIEYKTERGENKYQDTTIQKNGTIWVGNTEVEEKDENEQLVKRQLIFRVFVPKVN